MLPTVVTHIHCPHEHLRQCFVPDACHESIHEAHIGPENGLRIYINRTTTLISGRR